MPPATSPKPGWTPLIWRHRSDHHACHLPEEGSGRLIFADASPAGGAPGVLAGIGLLLAFASSLSWAWTALGLSLRTPQAVMSTGTVVLFPLILASNVFVAPRTMPGWLQTFVAANPVSHLVTAERSLFYGHPSARQIALVLAASAVLAAVFAPVTAWLYGRQR